MGTYGKGGAGQPDRPSGGGNGGSSGIYSEAELRDSAARAKADRARAARDRAGTTDTFTATPGKGEPDLPGEAKEKMVAAGVISPEGKYKEITGYYVDPTTGKKKFVAKGEPIPTFVREPEPKQEVPPAMRDPMREPIMGTGLEPEHDIRRPGPVSGTRYEPTSFEPQLPEKIREPGYFERKLQAWDIAVSKIIPSKQYFEAKGRPYREKHGWKQPKILDVPLAFTHAAYEEIEKKPVTTAAKTAAFVALTKGIGAGTGFIRTVPKIGKPIAEKAIPVGLAGVGVAYGASVHKRITAPEITIMQREIAGAPLVTEERIERERTKAEKAGIAGKIFAGEILPMGVGGAIGIKPLPKVSLPTLRPKVTPKPEPTLKYRLGRSKTEVEKFTDTMLAKQKFPEHMQVDIKGIRRVSPETGAATYVAKVQASVTDPLGMQTPIYTGISVIGKKPVHKIPVPVTIKKVSKPSKPKDVFKEAESQFRATTDKIHKTRLKSDEAVIKTGRQQLIVKTKQIQKQQLKTKQIQTQLQEQLTGVKPKVRAKQKQAQIQKQAQKQTQIQKQMYVYPRLKEQEQMMLVSEKQKYALLQDTMQKQKQKQLYYMPTQAYVPSFRLDQLQLPKQDVKQIQALKQSAMPKETFIPKEIAITKLKKPVKRTSKIIFPLIEKKKRAIRRKKRVSKARRYQILNPSAAVDDFMSKTIGMETFVGQPKKSKKRGKKK